MRQRVLVTLAVTLTVAPAVGTSQAFNFETVAAGNYPSLTLTSGGQSLTVAPEGGPGSTVIVRDWNVPLLGSLSPGGASVPAGLPPIGGWVPMRFTFLQPIAAITFAFGDAGGEGDSPARIQAFDAAGVPLGTFDTPYPEGASTGDTRSLVFGGAGAKYFILSSGSQAFGGQPDGFNDNSLGWEVSASSPAAAVAAPEPATLALTAGGLLALAGVARRRRAR